MAPLVRAAAAVVGAGTVAKQHLQCLAEMEGAELVAVCDLSPAVAESAAERFGVPAHYTDHRELLAALSPDVVHVTTPPAAHLAIATDALESGAHVIVEKPIVTDPAQLEPLLEEAERRERILIENYNYVFNPQLRRILDLIGRGELGEVVHVEVDLAVDILGEGSPFADPNRPHGTAAMAGGAVADFLPHLCSLVYFLAGPHRSASSMWSRCRGDVFDLHALVDAERATASLSFSARSQPDGFWVRVHGSRMRVEANLFEPRLTIERVRSAPAPLFPVLNGAGEVAAVGRAAVSGLWGKLRGEPGAYAGLWELVRRTYDSLAAGTPPPVTPSDIRAVNRLVEELVAEQRVS